MYLISNKRTNLSKETQYCPEKTKVVLIDEPDAHLQEDMQVKFAEILKKMQQELGIQIILATHSSAIIRNAELDEVIPMLPYASVNKPLRNASQVKTEQENAGQAYAEELPIGGLDAYEIGRAKINGKLVFLQTQ